MHKDWQGREIKIGARVQHRYNPPWKANETPKFGTPECNFWHNFSGVSEVVAFHGKAVEVRPTVRGHVPVHCSGLLEVVDPA